MIPGSMELTNVPAPVVLLSVVRPVIECAGRFQSSSGLPLSSSSTLGFRRISEYSTAPTWPRRRRSDTRPPSRIFLLHERGLRRIAPSEIPLLTRRPLSASFQFPWPESFSSCRYADSRMWRSPCSDISSVPSYRREKPWDVVSSSSGTSCRSTGSTAEFISSSSSAWSWSAFDAGSSMTWSTSTTPGSRPSAAAVLSTIGRFFTSVVCTPGLPMVTPLTRAFHSCQCVPEAV